MRSRWSFRSKILSRESTALSRWIAQSIIDLEMLDGKATDFYIRRTHAGHWQRSEGAWSWTLDLIDTENRSHPSYGLSVGSPWPASHLRKSGLDAWFNKYGQLECVPKSIVATTSALRLNNC
jgi:hypothetical protein